jgi:hypothetical protein
MIVVWLLLVPAALLVLLPLMALLERITDEVEPVRGERADGDPID